MEELLDEKLLVSMLETIRQKYGYDFSGYASSSLGRRIARFMVSNKFFDLQVLTDKLLSDDVLFEEFVQSLSVTVTDLFRDPSFFSSIREMVLSRLATYPIIKVWVAGCATGQEVFSIAILLREAGLLERSIIYATDINQQSLHTARQGVYPTQEIIKYESNYINSGGKGKLSDYYSHSQGSALFDRTLTEKVIYSPHNLATDQSFNEFQLILCRNVIMYFDRYLQDKVIGLFSESLCSFGYIGLGDKESFHFSEHKAQFEEVDSKQKIYRKIISS
jgi:chemotaxis protein methyltransferase CheR